MEDLTFMYCPGDDLNKARVMVQLEASEDEDEEDGESDVDESEGVEEDVPDIKVNSLLQVTDMDQ